MNDQFLILRNFRDEIYIIVYILKNPYLINYGQNVYF
jgi:hypothetical protein